jgi:hypothetical protein
MTVDIDLFLENELVQAPRTLTSNLFHYTESDVAIFNILASGTLRLSPFESTNDLWESRPLYPGLSAHADDVERSNQASISGKRSTAISDFTPKSLA